MGKDYVSDEDSEKAISDHSMNEFWNVEGKELE